jgi:hypothetical protein
MSKPSPMGSTFAERKAAREGKPFDPPAAPETGNTTFAERAGKPSRGDRKAVQEDDETAENKAVKSAASKRPAKKS